MEIDQVRHLGDGVHVQFDGRGFRLMSEASGVSHRVDVVYLTRETWSKLKQLVEETLDKLPTVDGGHRET